MMKPGGFMEIYFDDLEYNGRAQDFAQDPHAEFPRSWCLKGKTKGSSCVILIVTEMSMNSRKLLPFF